MSESKRCQQCGARLETASPRGLCPRCLLKLGIEGPSTSGMSCFPDTSTNSYPGVDVTCVSLTTGAAGPATSFYGGGTDWVHKWRATLPVVPGMNTIRISAFDPGGSGGSVTVDVAD